MHIALAGPISTESIAEFLDGEVGSLPKGYGGAPFFSSLIKGLLARGHQVSAFTTDSSLPLDQKKPFSAAGDRFSIFYLPSRKHSIRPNGSYPGRIVDLFSLERRILSEAIAQVAPDVVHAHWTYEFSLAGLATGHPCVVTCHDSPLRVLRYMPNLYRLGRYFMARDVLKKAPILTAVSPYLQEQIGRHTSTKVAVIPNPMPEAAEKQNLAGNRSIHANKPRFGMILNGWGTLKNPQSAIRAFAKVRNRIPAAEFHLFGSDFQPDGMAERWARKRGLCDGICFHGRLPYQQLLQYLEYGVDILVHPALEEACSMTIVEAMAFGVPVIGGSTSGGVPWQLGYGKAGRLVNVRDADQIASVMMELVSAPEMYSRLSLLVRERAHELFGRDAVAAAYEAQYRIASGTVSANGGGRSS